MYLEIKLSTSGPDSSVASRAQERALDLQSLQLSTLTISRFITDDVRINNTRLYQGGTSTPILFILSKTVNCKI